MGQIRMNLICMERHVMEEGEELCDRSVCVNVYLCVCESAYVCLCGCV